MTSLRLSPHSGDFVAVTRAFAEVASGSLLPKQGLARLQQVAPERDYSNGFLFGACGAAALPAV